MAYRFSVPKEMYQNGINILSIFSSAQDRPGISLKNMVSVEISEANRNTVRCCWEQTSQTRNLYYLVDITQLDKKQLEGLMSKFCGFDLVIGGSPCNNLAGGNRVHRVGLKGKESRLFYDFFWIPDTITDMMVDM